MRYPNLRYGNPTELAYYAMGRELADLARSLRRDERTVRDWLSGRTRVPWWVPEILRLRRVELDVRMRQMGMGALAPRLGVVAGDVIELHAHMPGGSTLSDSNEAEAPSGALRVAAHNTATTAATMKY